MDKYKAIPYVVTTHHKAVVDEQEPWNSSPAYDSSETRFRIVSTETGEVLDDAQGYGYKTAQKAYAGYAYKAKSKSKKSIAKSDRVEKWLKKNSAFTQDLEDLTFQAAKEGRSVNAELVEWLLKEHGLSPWFSVAELLRTWNDR